MKRFIIAVALLACVGCVSTIQQRNWQVGRWRDSGMETVDKGSVSVPIAFAPNTAPMYVSIPDTGTVQTVAIEGSDGILYVAARQVKRPWPLIVNDFIEFAVEKDRLYTKGDGSDETKEFWFKVVKRVRTKPAE